MNRHRCETVATSSFPRKPLALFTALLSLGLPLSSLHANEEDDTAATATSAAAPLEVGSTVGLGF